MLRKRVSPRGLSRRYVAVAVTLVVLGLIGAVVVARFGTFAGLVPCWASWLGAYLTLRARRPACQRALESVGGLLCPECEYDVRDLVHDWNVVCPECGRHWTCSEMARHWHIQIWGRERGVDQ